MERVLEGVLVDSHRIGRAQVVYDTDTGLIVDVGDLGFPRNKVDDFFDDACLVFAGFGDVHVHAREDASGRESYKEDFLSASQAALGGGLAYFVDMPNNPRPPVDEESFREKYALTLKAPIPIFLYAGIGPGTRPLPFAVPYKAYMGPSVGELFFRNTSDLHLALGHYRGLDVSFHCEDPKVLEECRQEASHPLRRPVHAETAATSTALALIGEFGLRGKLCHYSAGLGLGAIGAARRAGVEVQCEASPQHLYFCDEDIGGFSEEKGRYFQMNPPIRPRRERDALLAAFLEGKIDFLATDHAPHSREEKLRGASGLPGLDTFGPFACWLMGRKGASPRLVARTCAENPGAFVNRFLAAFEGLGGRKKGFFGRGFGFIRPGYMASFSVLDRQKPWCVGREELATKAGRSPFEGIVLPGSVAAVFVAGQRLV